MLRRRSSRPPNASPAGGGAGEASDRGALRKRRAGYAAPVVAENEVVEPARGRRDGGTGEAGPPGKRVRQLVSRLRKRLARAFDAEVVGESFDVDRRARRDAAQHLEKAARGSEARVHLEQEVAAEEGLLVLAFLREDERVPKRLEDLLPRLGGEGWAAGIGAHQTEC